MEPSEKPIEDLISKRLSGIIGPQLGRAGRHFVAYRRRQRRIRWAVGSGIAACLIGTLLLPFMRGNTPQQVAIKEIAPAPQTKPIQAEYVVFTRKTGEKTILVDGKVPMREVHRKVLQKMDWYDPEQKAQVKVQIPREQVVMMPLRTY